MRLIGIQLIFIFILSIVSINGLFLYDFYKGISDILIIKFNVVLLQTTI